MTSPVMETASIDPIQTAALHYFARERSGDPAIQSELEDWLEADPHHRAAYEELRQLWTGLDAFRSAPALLAMREEALDEWRSRRRLRGVLVGLAASVAVVVGVGTAWVGLRSGLSPSISAAVTEQHWSTGVGQMQTIVLADGSTAELDTASAISVRIGQAGTRMVEVTRGRALFEVAKRPGRPFLVHAGPIAVTAVGTKFDIYRMTDGVVVNLVEGRLRVGETSEAQQETNRARIDMAAGDKLEVRNDKWLLARGAIGRSADWAGGQLVFEQAPVSVIIAELSRYTDRKLVLGDDAVGSQKISAVIRTDNPLMFLNAIRVMRVARVRKIPNGYIIESARP